MLSLPIAFRSAIGVFAPVFSRPVWQHVKVLLTGAVLAPGKRPVTAILQRMGRSAVPDFQTYYRVLHRAVWSPLTASRLPTQALRGGVHAPRCSLFLALMTPSNADVASRSPPKASTGTPCVPHTRMLSKSVACAGLRV